MNNELERIWKIGFGLIDNHWDNFLGMTKAMRHLSQNIRCPGWVSSQAPSKYKSTALPLDLSSMHVDVKWKVLVTTGDEAPFLLHIATRFIDWGTQYGSERAGL
jgi:hypothetical protein